MCVVGRLLIIDGHAYAYRAFYAIRSLRSPGGRPTNAIYGFIKMLEKMISSLRPEFVAVIWDGGLSAERVALMPHYKAQRPEMPADLKPQFDEIISYLKAAGVVSLCGEGIEADDYIASLARLAERAGVAVVIASSDKDFMQLVSPNIGLFNPNDKSGMIWSNVQVVAKLGVAPEQVVDWLSLVGDTVDNIHGVPGVGAKTATDLLAKFGSLENLYARLAEVKPERLRAALAGAADLVRQNVAMVRLRDNLPCDFSPAGYRVGTPAVATLRNLFCNWGFKGLLAALEGAAPDGQQSLI
jgi:DNA polymerase-1